MKNFHFKFLNVNGYSKNNLFAVSGNNVEILEEIWVELSGRMYDTKKGYGMMRDRKDKESRLFEDFSGLLANAEGELFLDTEKKKIYVTNSAVLLWFIQLENLNGIVQESFSRILADKISKLTSYSPLIIVREPPSDK